MEVKRHQNASSEPVTAPRLTVAIATYDGRHLLETVLRSLREQSFEDFRVVVVDDASSDDTLEWMAAHWPRVETIVHPRNRGVTAALNTCLKAGAESELVALLNNDVELHRDCLAELVAALDAHPEAGSACAKLLASDDRALLDGAGDTYTWGGEANRRGQGQPDTGQYDTPQEVFSACGAVAVYRRDALEEVGMLDERFFALYEDVDWCYRAQLAGWTCRYVPTAVAYHMGSATLGKGASDFTLFHNWRNQIWVVAKNHPASALVRHAPELALVQARNLGIALRRGRGRLWLKVWRSALTGMPAVLRERRRVQRSRVRSTTELDALIGADR
ncbi:MAG TPA: glycosyltransferase family 2 protein [Solirubrobacteraceae bacterium]|nr:glycosyltransferase family 2 protein [Solirubrobacteraceae bacterium]